jgi:tRNA A37 methylthiotransferase MiaB
MVETLTQEQKLERLKVLQAKQEVLTSERLARWVGKEVEVLIDNRNLMREGCLQGRISQGFVLNFDQPYAGLKLGDKVTAKVVGQKRFTLLGELSGV